MEIRLQLLGLALPGVAEDALHVGEIGGEVVFEQGLAEGFLGAEVVVERALGDTSGGQHFVQAHRREPLGAHDPLAGGQDPVTDVGGVRGGRGVHGCHCTSE
ncbi:hypothetical protein D3C72_1349260 [compost metagenome]